MHRYKLRYNIFSYYYFVRMKHQKNVKLHTTLLLVESPWNPFLMPWNGILSFISYHYNHIFMWRLCKILWDSQFLPYIVFFLPPEVFIRAVHIFFSRYECITDQIPSWADASEHKILDFFSIFQDKSFFTNDDIMIYGSHSSFYILHSNAQCVGI